MSIEGMGSDQELLDWVLAGLLEARLKAGGGPLVARVFLTGRGILHRHLGRPSYMANLTHELQDRLPLAEEDFICLESILASTGAAVDLEELARSDTLLGDLLSLVRQARDDGGLRAELRRSLEGLLEHPRAGRYLDVPGEAELDRLLARAGELAVDLLAEGEGPCG
ncbi:MAG: hypothetical protein K6T29_04400 [Peptococcaceae bacterium]|nr:hypothetical protein [Peptococcaceae bacterium]